jgi:CHAT domain-containing protein
VESSLLYRAAIVAIVVCGALIGTFWFRRQHGNDDLFQQALQSRSTRIVEGRLSGFDWAPESRYFRGPTTDVAGSSLLEPAARAISREQQRVSPNSLRDAALARLVISSAAEAARSMENAARLVGSDARLWSDAAALRIEEWRASGEMHLIIEALALADRALSLDPQLPEAHFNRALALEKLGLRQSATFAYRYSATNETRASWENETATRIRTLRRPSNAAIWSTSKAALHTAALQGDRNKIAQIVASFPQQARTWAEGECLSAWSDALRARKTTEAENLLITARLTAEALKSFNGESLLHDAVKAIEIARSRAKRLSRLAEAHDIYRRGRIEFSRMETEKASRDLYASVALFNESQSPMAAVALYYAASAQFESGDRSKALDVLRDLRARVKPPHFALRAHIDWEIGTVLGSRGDLYDATIYYGRALQGFERLKETESAAQMRTMLAKSLNLLGDSSEATRVRQRAIQIAGDSGNDRLLEFALGELAGDEILAKRWETAQAIQKIAIQEVKATNPRRRFDILFWRALIAKPIDLRSLEAALSLIPDKRLHADAEDDLRFAKAMALREADPRAAAALLTKCIAYEEAPTGRTLTLPHLYLERARNWRRAKNTVAAIADYSRSLAFFESRRTSIESRDYRDAFVGTAAEAFDELMQIRLERGEHSEVVDLGERKRGRVFLDSVGGGTERATPLSVAAMVSRVPLGTRLILYTTVGETVLVTTVEHDSSTTRTLSQRASWVASKAIALRAALESGSESAPDSIINDLSKVLQADFAGRGRVVVASDPPMNDVPFAVLKSRSGRFLLEEVTLVRTPSASTFLQAGAVRRGEHRLLAIGDPAFSRDAFPRLERLPEAGQEVADIAPLYPKATTLTGTGATFDNLQRFSRGANVIHLATHTVTSTADASLSHLILAADGSSSGACSVRRVARMELSAGSTVILAGCRTAVGDGRHGDLRDFANAFLAAGAREVVGSQWSVDDAATRKLVIRFHRHFKQGKTSEDALRQSQLEMLHGTDRSLRSPRSWASFQVYKTGS